MSYNGSGTFNINTAGQPVVTGTVISSTAFNALTADLATGLSTAITKDGQTAATARIPFAQGISSTLVTDSTSTTTGSIITAGGAGVAKALFVGTTANVAGAVTLQSTLGVTGITTFSAQPIFSSLTASSAVATDASKGLVSVTNTGTGSNVLGTSPTITTPTLATPNITTGLTLTGSPGTSGQVLTSAGSGLAPTWGASGDTVGFKNRIINGAMVIDQRNAGASFTPTASSQYSIDRFCSVSSVSSKFSMQQNAGSVTPPVGFINYLGATSLSAYSVGSTDVFGIRQIVEGFNTSELGWGTANAQPITISFWVRSSLTGTFGLGLGNSGFSRAYAAAYVINSANTWEYKTITIAGDTTGTWLTTNAVGIQVTFGFGFGSSYLGTAGVWNAGSYFMPTGATSVVGTSGATFYITGVQLEKGSTATSFDYRPYGTELALCQRYFEKSYNMSVVPGTSSDDGTIVFVASNSNLVIPTVFKVSKRSVPTMVFYSSTGASGFIRNESTSSDLAVSLNRAGDSNSIAQSASASNGSQYSMQFTASSEL